MDAYDSVEIMDVLKGLVDGHYFESDEQYLTASENESTSSHRGTAKVSPVEVIEPFEF